MRKSFTIIVASLLVTASAVMAKMPDQKTIQATIDAAVLQSFEELKLGPVEKKIFDSEVALESQPFVTNYRPTADGTAVQVDQDKLRNFLKFTSKEGMAAPKFCVRAKSAGDCPICESLAQAMQARWLNRLEKRGFGFKPSPEMPAGYELTGERAFDDFVSAAAGQGCEAYLFTELERDRAPEQDEHGSEFRMKATSFLSLRETGLRKIRARADTILLVPVSFDSPGDKEKALSAVMGRQSAELFAQAGSKLGALETADRGIASQMSNDAAAHKEEGLISLEKVQNYELYARFKTVFAKFFPDVEIEERYVRPGVVQFAVKNIDALIDLPKRLQQVDWQGRKLELIRATPNEVVVALQ